jgi:excisionase family DNA binding protein
MCAAREASWGGTSGGLSGIGRGKGDVYDGRPRATLVHIQNRRRASYDPDVLTVEEAATRVGRSPDTVRRWIRSGRLAAATEGRRRVIDPADLDAIRDELYPMLPLPPEWQQLEDGTPAPNWVATVALSRSGP